MSMTTEEQVKALSLWALQLEKRCKRLTWLCVLSIASTVLVFAYVRWGGSFGSSITAKRLDADEVTARRVEVRDSGPAKEATAFALTVPKEGVLLLERGAPGASHIVVLRLDDSNSAHWAQLIWPTGMSDTYLSARRVLYITDSISDLRKDVARIQEASQTIPRDAALTARVDAASARIDKVEGRVRALETRK